MGITSKILAPSFNIEVTLVIFLLAQIGPTRDFEHTYEGLTEKTFSIAFNFDFINCYIGTTVEAHVGSIILAKSMPTF